MRFLKRIGISLCVSLLTGNVASATGAVCSDTLSAPVAEARRVVYEDVMRAYAEDFSAEPVFKNKLVNQHLVARNYLIGDMVNPHHENKTVGYLCAGVDWSTIEMMTRGARTFYFLDYVSFSPWHFKKALYDRWDELVPEDPAYASYVNHKYQFGFAHGQPKIREMEEKLAIELKLSGVKRYRADGSENITVDRSGAFTQISFWWAPQGRREEQKFTINYVFVDLFNPDQYPDSLKKLLLSRDVDVWYLSAGLDLVEHAESFLPYFSWGLKEGGHFVVSDFSCNSRGESTFADALHNHGTRSRYVLPGGRYAQSLDLVYERCARDQVTFRGRGYGWQSTVYRKLTDRDDVAQLFTSAVLRSA